MFDVTMKLSEYSGPINVGDLVVLKPDMMLVDAEGPAIILEIEKFKSGEAFTVMYLKSQYITNCDRIDIERVLCEA